MVQMQKQKWLLLSGDFGDGHKQAARAIAETTGQLYPDIETATVDFMQWTHPHLHSLGRYCYLQWVTHFPSVYGYLFQKTRDDNSFSQLFKKVKLFNMERMLKLLQDTNPDVVVSTFPSAAAAMSILKANGLCRVPTVTVITDHTDHSYWIHPYTDRYIVGSDHVRRGLLRQNVPDSLIEVTGIPIRQPFTHSYDREALRDKHGLCRSQQVVLVMGGGLGMIGRDIAELVRAGRVPSSLQFVFVCGRNPKLYSQLADELRGCSHRCIVTGYVDYVHELMALSDLIITKPGGLTTSEAIASELPMLLYKPLPGQEKDNAAFLVKAGLARQAENPDELVEQLINLFQNPQNLTKIKERAKQYPVKAATAEALSAIVRTRNASLPTRVRAAYAEA